TAYEVADGRACADRGDVLVPDPAGHVPPLDLASRRLQQPALGKEQLFVDPQSVPVGHAGDVVGDTGRQVSRRSMVLLWNLLGVIEVVREQAPDHRDRL